MNGADRARCRRCGGEEFERVEDLSASGAVTEGHFFGTAIRLEYRCTACGELSKLIPPGRDERYPTRGRRPVLPLFVLASRPRLPPARYAEAVGRLCVGGLLGRPWHRQGVAWQHG